MLNKPHFFILIPPSFYLSTPVFWLTYLHNLQKKNKKVPKYSNKNVSWTHFYRHTKYFKPKLREKGVTELSQLFGHKAAISNGHQADALPQAESVKWLGKLM